jgi:hypothetical protein
MKYHFEVEFSETCPTERRLRIWFKILEVEKRLNEEIKPPIIKLK